MAGDQNAFVIDIENNVNADTDLIAIKIGGKLSIDSSVFGGDSKLVKQTPYDTTLTVAGPIDLADMTGSVFGCSDAYGDGPFTQTPYKLVTTDIESVIEDGEAITQVGWAGASVNWTDNSLTWSAIPDTNNVGNSGGIPSKNSQAESTPFTAYAPDAPWGVGTAGSNGWAVRMPEKRTILGRHIIQVLLLATGVLPIRLYCVILILSLFQKAQLSHLTKDLAIVTFILAK